MLSLFVVSCICLILCFVIVIVVSFYWIVFLFVSVLARFFETCVPLYISLFMCSWAFEFGFKLLGFPPRLSYSTRVDVTSPHLT